MSDAAITVDNVSKRFRIYHERNQSLKSALLRRRRGDFEEFWALQDVSLEVPQGASMGLIGENGSGKSTLLKCMAKILRPDAGRIATEGKISALLELGAGFHQELSGRENVYLNGSILGLSRKELDRKFDDIVQLAGLERFIDSPVKTYSSGMYLRLGFSVAINVNPDVLLVDEVLAVGDEQFQRRCKDKFAELRQQGRTVVLVSHALETIRELCASAAWLDGGSLRSQGPVDVVVDGYLDAQAPVPPGGDGAPGGRGSSPGAGGNAVVGIELLDEGGRHTREALTGDAVTLRFHYALDRSVARPVFGMAIHTGDGIEVTTAAMNADVTAAYCGRQGHVDLRVSSLPLLPGAYDVSATIADGATGAVLDEHRRAFRFVVDAGAPHGASGGIVDLGGSWHLCPSLPAQTRPPR
ncbi:MAG TPA: ABC transporter ATP-binding protein [Acidimicrobiales bacterium]|nr:ABC transporter ATP-binding protein [Acidimicrobiales bacterium]